MASITLSGCSGKSYKFTVKDFGVEMEPIGAVYCVIKERNNSNSHIYLGITNDLSTRFENHHKENCFKKHNANKIAIYKCSSKSDRKKIEEDILCKNDFPCNEQNN